MHSSIEYLAHRLLQRRVPKWYGAFCDPVAGGFYERLGHGFQPVNTGQRRLLTQCRQLAIYSHALAQKETSSFAPGLRRHFSHIVAAYRIPGTGGWRFSLDDSGKPLDDTIDLYTLSFVIFSFSHYYRAKDDEEARLLARETLDFILANMRISGTPGFAEALSGELNSGELKILERTRRQNPHMHLLEACLFAYETWGDKRYLEVADEMVALFYGYFFDAERCFLGEYYSRELSRDPEKGHIAEPGHYFEWVWLLKKHAAIKASPDVHDEACERLLQFANTHGWDNEVGGIYDELDSGGKVLKSSKRLWPFTEALKANALMLDSGTDKDFLKSRVAEMVDIFHDNYMDERGFWTEWLDRDLSPGTDYMPGTTPYHVYFGIMETRDALRSRGYSKSVLLKPAKLLYSMRRYVSAVTGRIRNSIR